MKQPGIGSFMSLNKKSEETVVVPKGEQPSDNDDKNSYIPVKNTFNFYCDIPETAVKKEEEEDKKPQSRSCHQLSPSPSNSPVCSNKSSPAPSTSPSPVPEQNPVHSEKSVGVETKEDGLESAGKNKKDEPVVDENR